MANPSAFPPIESSSRLQAEQAVAPGAFQGDMAKQGEFQSKMLSTNFRLAPFLPNQEMLSVETTQVSSKGPIGGKGSADDHLDDNTTEEQTIITIKGRKYLIYEGRVIDEREADKIYKLYHDLIAQKRTALEAQ